MGISTPDDTGDENDDEGSEEIHDSLGVGDYMYVEPRAWDEELFLKEYERLCKKPYQGDKNQLEVLEYMYKNGTLNMSDFVSNLIQSQQS